MSDYNPNPNPIHGTGDGTDSIKPQPIETLNQIKEWLLPTEYKGKDSQLSKHLDVHIAGTGEWLLESDKYQQWKLSDSQGFLLLCGIPGSGKSVAAARIVQKLAAPEDAPILYFFFRRIIDANQSFDSALRDWLHQLLPYSPLLQQILANYVTNYRQLSSVSREDLWKHLRSALGSMDKCYIVADALDEMNTGVELNKFLNSLIDLAQWKPAKIKILVTSRPVPRVQNPLKLGHITELRLEEKDVDTDIIIYVQHRLEASDIPLESYSAIKAAVPGRANGLFLYAKLAMDTLTSNYTANPNVQDILEKLPIDLNVMYNDLLQENAQRTGVSAAIQTLILQLATHATRPLRLLEVAQCLSTVDSIGKGKDLSEIKSLVRSSCGALLEILPTEIVSVVHHSFTEFLTGVTRTVADQSYPVLDKGQAEMTLALTCLHHLQAVGFLGALEINEDNDSDSLSDCDERYWDEKKDMMVFTQYAGENWFVHARKSALAGVDQQALNTLLDSLLVGSHLKKLFRLSQHLSVRDSNGTTILYAIIVWGLVDYAKQLLGRPDIDTSRCGKIEDGPFIRACKEGYTDIVDLLLQRPEIKIDDFDQGYFVGQAALQHAVLNNHITTITRLLEAGANPLLNSINRDPSNDGGNTDSPLELACKYGRVEALQVMLPYIKDSEPLSVAAWNALWYVRVETVEVLCRHEHFDINNTRWDTTLLMRASGYHSKTLVRCLLAAGADPNMKASPKDRTALHDWAAKGSYEFGYCDEKPTEEDEDAEATLRMLVDAGADVNIRDFRGNTPLHCVSDIATAKLLLGAGALADVVNKEGEGIAKQSIIGRDPELFRFLSETAAAAINTATNDGDATDSDSDFAELQTDTENELIPKAYRHLFPAKPTNYLLNSLSNDDVDAVFNYLRAGIGLDAVDQDGNGPLHYAVGMRYQQHKGPDQRDKVITEIIKAGTDVNQRNYKGEMAMHLLGAGPGRHISAGSHRLQWITYKPMIAAGADVNARDNKGKTPLFHYLEKPDEKYMEILEAMKEAGGSLQILDYEGRNLLFSGFDINRLDAIEWLLAQDLDAGHVDHQGMTIFHSRVHCGIGDAVLNKLLVHGLDPIRANHAGRTPLHSSSAINPFEDEDRSRYQSYGGPRPEPRPIFEEILSRFQHDSALVNAQDNQGVTALHLASTHSEYVVRRLLQAGADPCIATHEGMTAFHLAARARQPSVLLVLINHLRKQKKKLKETVNSNDKNLNQPLHYAIASGTIESVQLLIDAKAKFDAETAVSSCVAFENEDSNWPSEGKKGRSQYLWSEEGWKHGAGSTSLKDTHRTYLGYKVGYPTARLEEIVSLIEKHKPDKCIVENVIYRVAAKGYDYTCNLLLEMRSRMGFEDDFLHNFASLSSVNRRTSLKRSFDEYNDMETRENKDKPNPYHKTPMFNFLMSQREYSLAQQVAIESVYVAMDEDGGKVLHELARKGFAALMSDILTDALSSATGAVASDYRGKKIAQTLLITACKSRQPNMDVIRLLVEKFHPNINYQPEKSAYSNHNEYYGTALHVLARGVYSWQASLGIPYLVHHGADLETYDGSGATALHEAIHSHHKAPTRSIGAAKALIELGADVNALDSEGKSCLVIAIETQDADHVENLTSKGAVYSTRELLVAIHDGNLKAVESALQSGANPNERIVFSDRLPNGNWDYMAVHHKQPDEMFPLHFAIDSLRPSSIGKPNPKPTVYNKILMLLLEHGADPNTRYGNTSIGHYSIENYKSIDELLAVGSFDVNAVDEQGRSLFLLACRRGNGDAATKLLARGADLHKRDKKCRNALHHLFLGGLNYRAPELMPLLAKERDLINSPDSDGFVPILALMESGFSHGESFQLLLANGADPCVAGPDQKNILHFIFGCGYLATELDALKAIFAIPGVQNLLNKRNIWQQTPIFHYISGRRNYCDSSKTVENTELVLLGYLDKAGVDWTVVDEKRQSLLHVCAATRNAGCFKFLLDKGLDWMAEDNQHKSPLDIASEARAEDILALFDGKHATTSIKSQD